MVWFYYSSKPQRFNWRLSLLQNIYIENNATPIKQDKEMNVYTKEMQEAGELMPKAGMSAVLDGVKVVFVIGVKRNGGLVFEYEHGSTDSFNDEVGNKRLTPIDTRTDTEKAVDDLADGISASYSDDQSFKEDARRMLDLIKTGKIHGITFTGDK